MLTKRKRRTIWGLVGLILLVIAFLMLGVFRETIGLSRGLGKQKVEDTTTRLVDEIHMYFQPTVDGMLLSKGLMEDGTIDLDDARSITSVLKQLLAQQTHIASVSISKLGKDEAKPGVVYFLGSDKDFWITGTAVKPGDALTWKQWEAESKKPEDATAFGNIVPQESLLPQGDVRAASENTVHWSRPFSAAKSNLVFLSGWVKWQAQKDGPCFVLLFTVLLDDLVERLNHVVPQQEDKVFVYTPEGLLMCLHGIVHNKTAQGVDRFGMIGANVKDPVLVKTLQALRGNEIEDGVPFLIDEKGKKWWAGTQRLSDAPDASTVIFVVPETEALGSYLHQSRMLLTIAGATLFLGAVVAGLLLYIYRRRAGTHAPENDPFASEQALLDVIAQGEGDEVEFKSTLRYNLKSEKPGKEIEFASLKTLVAYLNTDGGTLLVGVGDDGELLGLEKDNFVNDDKFMLHFNNIFNKHVGPEFTQYVRFDVRVAMGKKVFIVQCAPSPQPVFLKNNNNEDFYIRSGPASRKLTMSQFLDYLNAKAGK